MLSMTLDVQPYAKAFSDLLAAGNQRLGLLNGFLQARTLCVIICSRRLVKPLKHLQGSA